jgi:S-adenosylmethionine:tRNA ribosyltransferase-isomerase
MQTSDFDFSFPENLIAYQPLPRGESRMLVAGRDGAPTTSSHTRHLIDYMQPGDALVLNDTKVLRARLIAAGPGGGRVEALLLAPAATSSAGEVRWEAMVKPGKRFRQGDEAEFSPRLRARVERVNEDGTRILSFAIDPSAFFRELEAVGRIPLPPYIRREASESDAAAYQSVFAEKPGSVAAPTASLHLSGPMLEAVRAKGIGIVKVTLHVGAGTFKPVQSETLAGHVMHSESYAMSEGTAAALNAVRKRNGKIFAVGTTAARVLETQARADGSFAAGAGDTRIFIYPGYRWKGVDALLTNFHWPKSTLFMLVCSLLGTERAKAVYAEAFAAGFRLFSYGDAMLIR